MKERPHFNQGINRKKIFNEANQIRAEISDDLGSDEWIIPPAIAALVFGISVKNLERMAEENQSLTISPLSPEKVRISREGYKGSSSSYRELCMAVQMTAEGRRDAFSHLSPDLENWSLLREFRERLGNSLEPDEEEMQDLLIANFKTLKPATQKEMENRKLHPSQIFSNSGLRRSGM